MTGLALQVGIGPLENWVGNVLGQLPELFLGLVLLAVAYFAGGWAGGKAGTLSERMDLGEAVLETPLGVVFEEAGEVNGVIAGVVKLLFVLFGLAIAASMAGFNRIFDTSQFLVSYVPSVLGAVLIVLVGFVVAGYVARSVKASDVVGGHAFTPVIATTIKAVIYFVVITLALDALGYSTAILNTLAQAVAIGVGLGVALAIGISLGMGSQDYVAENIDDWMNE